MSGKKKILVTGFPHCGTSILKSKLGECTNVYEQINESIEPEKSELDKFIKSDKPFFLWKDPVLRGSLATNGFSDKNNTIYKNDVVVMIIRNPYYVFTSQIKRGMNPFKTFEHTYENYLNAARTFLDAKDNKYKDVYCIKYEDLFKNDYSQIKSIMDNIGLEYEANIFDTKTKIYSIGDYFLKEEFPKEKPNPTQRPGRYRYWQINQDFKNFNETAIIDIPKKLTNILQKSDLVTKLGYNQ